MKCGGGDKHEYRDEESVRPMRNVEVEINMKIEMRKVLEGCAMWRWR